MKADEYEPREFEKRRNALLKLLDSATCPVDFARFQAALAAEIIESERLKAQERKNKHLQLELKRHLHLCHHLGDGLAWRLLEPHTIRQLAKGRVGRLGFPINLSRPIRHWKRSAEWRKELNRSAIMADLTNIVRIGDVIVPNGSQCPLIFEFKSSTSRPLKGGYANRASRQLLRMELTAEYLNNDRGTLFGTDKEIRAITLGRIPGRWSYSLTIHAALSWCA